MARSTFEGAEGAEKIKRCWSSRMCSSAACRDARVAKLSRVKNFEKETIRDVEGDEIPKEKMLIFELADKTRIAVRGSGTEPKIKYYLFAQRRAGPAGSSARGAVASKSRKCGARLESLWIWLQRRCATRAGAHKLLDIRRLAEKVFHAAKSSWMAARSRS